MIYLNQIGQYEHEGPTVATIGKFDGIHRGHQDLMRRTVARARASADPRCAAVVIILDASERGLLSRRERVEQLDVDGIDYLLELPLNDEMKAHTAETFVTDFLVDTLKIEGVVVGEDFHFGRGRQGNAAFLVRSGKTLGFDVETVPDITEDGVRISSTEIRECLSFGLMERVNRYLGYNYFITGTVVHGNHIGHTLGVPTANIVPPSDKLLPPRGVYVSKVTIGDRTFKGMTNIGIKPTVPGSNMGAETYIFDFDEDLYGKEIKLELLHFSRPETQFASLGALKARLGADKIETLGWFEEKVR